MLPEEENYIDKDQVVFNYHALNSRSYSVFNTLILDRQESDIRQTPIFLHA